MRITVVRSGGFAGITRTYRLDSTDLSPAAAGAVHDLAREVVHGSRPVAADTGPPSPDSFEYDLEIDDAGTVHRCTVDESPSPSPSAALELARSVIAHAAS